MREKGGAASLGAAAHKQAKNPPFDRLCVARKVPLRPEARILDHVTRIFLKFLMTRRRTLNSTKPQLPVLLM
jgi:hypothetical protein